MNLWTTLHIYFFLIETLHTCKCWTFENEIVLSWLIILFILLLRHTYKWVQHKLNIGIHVLVPRLATCKWMSCRNTWSALLFLTNIWPLKNLLSKTVDPKYHLHSCLSAVWKGQAMFGIREQALRLMQCFLKWVDDCFMSFEWVLMTNKPWSSHLTKLFLKNQH